MLPCNTFVSRIPHTTCPPTMVQEGPQGKVLGFRCFGSNKALVTSNRSAFGAPQPRRLCVTCNDTSPKVAAPSSLTPASSNADTPDATLRASKAASPPPPTSSVSSLQANMQTRYEQAYSMSQLYASERPPPIPPGEHERRRRVKDVQEVVDAGRRRGLREEDLRSGLRQLDSLLPGVLSLHRMRPADWAVVAVDIDATAEKIILLKTLYPAANIFHITFRRPKLLLLSPQRLQQDAAEILRLLAAAPNPCSILEATPDLTDPLSLSRCLASLAAAFPGTDPVGLLVRSPDILQNLGSEAAVELTADYGELSTKD